ncbi:ABC transporter substrate-binding protein [Nocardiopsis gilva YIM 90087]|uniref:ABC transporter substrate-binding protein n=3 Tax=Nocardiopsis gilva TaxID=280236 RepID=A0A223S278_9ACTN|nr:ABC transporter permease [Nocardiopsis gilva]ASU82218.1 ABC transporter substrate-binding protein [Nocardiopsis gilva YIM 90087]
MFVAIRDIRFAKGRFALMGSVVALITLLVVLLSGLTAGLAAESVSAVDRLPADRIAFGAAGDSEPKESFADSSVTADQVDTWAGAEGVAWAEPLGITQTRVEAPDGSTTAATIFAAEPGEDLAPDGTADDSLVVGRSLADEKGLEVGDVLTLGGTDLTITRIARDDSYSHTPVVWTSLDTWRSFAPSGTANGSPAGTVIAIGMGADHAPADTAAIDTDAETVSATRSDSLSAIGAFSSENGSLLMIQGFLYAISALVVGAFLTVWTIQRSGDIAILKALGGSTGYLLRDALAQALLVLLAGAGVGGLAGFGVGVLAERVVPFSLTVATTVLPVAAMVVLGMLGAVLSVRRITSVDPLTALGGVR